MDARLNLITSLINENFLGNKAELYAWKLFDKCISMSYFPVFIDETVLAVARPKRQRYQLVLYDGHKRKHALKFQAVNSPDGLIQQVLGPMEGRRRDWTLYISSNLEEQLPTKLEEEGRRYCIYGDSGYNRRW